VQVGMAAVKLVKILGPEKNLNPYQRVALK
jgi:hypothetical protein